MDFADPCQAAARAAAAGIACANWRFGGART